MKQKLEPGEVAGSINITSNKEIYITTHVEEYTICSQLEIEDGYKLTILYINDEIIEQVICFNNKTDAKWLILALLNKKLNTNLHKNSKKALLMAIENSWLEHNKAQEKIKKIRNDWEKKELEKNSLIKSFNDLTT
tara:strand:- start:758 stop:1165 length:408 start_codon:yes stop_codon:yes gene_type:complete